ncbi:MAG: MnhB domain-containing protein [Oscillospiraceae bacterium]|nr:MnhB domain-containing protein [Oscillospiraceae bacterium]MBQ4316083.1 MnhB domain-containing protein [Oscillospiraceae bacterium]MBQ6698466.1 MnhB domain-containing protein [Oscillospiraceae bacterium]
MKFKNGISEKNVIMKCGADMMLPFAVVFGIYIILFGTVSPGGGFQGGVMVAAAAVLLYLAYGYNTAKQAINTEVLRVGEACGATLYVILGLCGIFLGANFCRNIFFDNGAVGDLISAGTITFMGYSVGFKVLTGVGFLLLLMMSLLAPGADDEEEEDAE